LTCDSNHPTAQRKHDTNRQQNGFPEFVDLKRQQNDVPDFVDLKRQQNDVPENVDLKRQLNAVLDNVDLKRQPDGVSEKRRRAQRSTLDLSLAALTARRS
jgi:hypothetical protein